MLILTEQATVLCVHVLGVVDIARSQSFVTIERQAMLVANDPEGRSISGCPLPASPTSWPCPTTMPVTEGYSSLLRIGGRRVCLSTVTGLTTGGPPGTFTYNVARPGQDFVSEL